MLFTGPNEYIIALKALSGNDFEDEVNKLLIDQFSDFQPVSILPTGDGGSDGFYKNFETLVCCYGLDFVSTTKEKKKIKEDIIAKFKKDLMRIFELKIDSGKGLKAKLKYKENKELKGILGNQKVKHIKLICNWAEDNSLIGELNKYLALYKRNSKKTFVDNNCTCTFLGPKDVTLLCDINNRAMFRVKNRQVHNLLEEVNQVDEDLNEDETKLDEKFDFLYDNHTNNDDERSKVTRLKDTIKDRWKKDILLDEKLKTSCPNVFNEIDRIKKKILEDLETSFLDNAKSPKEAMRECKKQIYEELKGIFSDWDHETIENLSNYSVATFIGVCPLDWR